MIIVVTGTNTDVGKTIATAALAAAWQDAGFSVRVAKPLQTGEPEGLGDANTVARLTGVRTHELARFPEPLAPNLSARRAGMQVPPLKEVCEWIRDLDTEHGVTLVEGAGGLLVRLADEYTVADIAAELRAPLVVVTSLELGSLNAAELTVREAQRRGVRVAGLIGGSLPADPDLATQLNLEELPVVTGVELWANIPAGAGALSQEEFAEMAHALGIPTPPR
ncbi:dethiobiotin synthase [Corynebacterium sp. HMSC074A01]|uniref:dethiobiotin synthase n=1 Tax=Corynebacterium sp. HMSC074A01 TaxID=1715030 RepID=UPI0008A267D2|nr:dethiobiotin synthase [Corynebacterium sp. HMSC074A01]OHF36764.1 dethiobiotin synthase [Corynebacterium sp. HMSC074A01]